MNLENCDFDRRSSILAYPLEHSGSDDFIVIFDCFTHDIVKSFEFVSRYRIRFFAGCCIIVEGAIIGTLCIADVQPRQSFSIFDKSILLDFAHSISLSCSQRRSDMLCNIIDCNRVISSLTSALNDSVVKMRKSILTLLGDPSEHNISKSLLEDVLKSLTKMEVMIESIPIKVSHLPLVLGSEEGGGAGGWGGSMERANMFAVLEYFREILPMLVSNNRAEYSFDALLKSAYVENPDVVFSITMVLVLPLVAWADNLTVTATFESFEHRSLTNLQQQHLSDYVTTLGRVKMHVEAAGRIELYDGNDGEGDVADTLQALSKGATFAEFGILQKTLTQRSLIYEYSIPCRHSETDSRRIVLNPMPLQASVSSVSESDTTPEVSKAKDKLQILVVDDCPMIQKVLTRFLTNSNCVVTSADNGLVGLKKLQSCSVDAGVGFDIVFMDFLMPVMDGLEATRKFFEWRKNNPQYDHVYRDLMIVGLSATANVVDQRQSIEFGMDYFLNKPANLKLMGILLSEKRIGTPNLNICDKLKTEASSNLK